MIKIRHLILSVNKLILIILLVSGGRIYGKTPMPVQTKDSLITISFGQNNQLIFHLNSGLYDISFREHTLKLSNASSRIIYKANNSELYISQSNNNSKENNTSYSFHKEEISFPKLALNLQGRNQLKNSNGTLYRFKKIGKEAIVEQLFFIYPDKDYFITQIKIFPIESGPVHQLSDSILSSNYISPLHGAVITGNNLANFNALSIPFDNDMWARYESVALDSTALSTLKSSEATAIYNHQNQGLIIGSLNHEDWKSGVLIDKSKNKNSVSVTAYAGFTDSLITHDNAPHGWISQNNTDGSCSSPKFLIGYFSNWQQGMELYGELNKVEEPPYIYPWNKTTPMGWNSWGVIQDKLDLNNAKGVVDFFHDSLTGFRTKDQTLYIDLDSYWDKLTPGGTKGDISQLKTFVQYCRQRGFHPGIYWGPFIDWGKQDRLVEGSAYHYSDCWIKANGKYLDIDGGRAMDPTHPATKARINYFVKFFKSCGFEMIKIDFLSHGSYEADRFFDHNVTTGMQAFKEGMEYLDKVLGNEMLVYAAISPNMATARYVHMRRIACDAFKNISESQYTLNSLTYGWWLAKMYPYLDADHVVFDQAAAGENRARLLSSIVTGTLITGDNYAKAGPWRAKAKDLLQNQELLKIVQHDGKPFIPLETHTGNQASHLFIKEIGNDLYMAIFNFENLPKTFDLSDPIKCFLKQNGFVNISKSKSGGSHLMTPIIGNLEEGNGLKVGEIKLAPKDAVLLKFKISGIH